ncbi:MAG: IS3 family transposase [Candidatus Pacebacteria bacterium]|nr:IS3 family transposase [Candidatus Paceibacterota bacterium]
MRENKSALARETGISRSTLYYKPKQIEKDWITKQLIEESLHINPSYGHKRLALNLNINKKRILRVMQIFGIKPYRRYTKKRFVLKPKDSIYPNLLIHESPKGIGDIWASDFTYIKYHGYWIYVATVIDVYSREVVGVSVLTTHGTQLIMNALLSSIHHRPPPRIIHSDQGSEYTSLNYTSLTQAVGIQQSMSRAGCPWENGYQESFYKGFKIDLGDPNRFETLGELVAEIYSTLYYYNTHRIHSALAMAPRQFVALESI